MNDFIDIEPSSFRDPSGFLFEQNNELFRQINSSYKNQYDKLMNSGLYDSLVEKHFLISHDEIELDSPEPNLCYKIIKPKKINFISYPYEWSFSQLKDSALCTLEIQKIALEFGMTLKDGTSYNIQFLDGKPILIDSLSFEIYEDGDIWRPYQQFCQHFLAPLSLMANQDIRFNQLLSIFLNGLPLDLTSKLLPFSTKTSFGLMSHIHLHAKSQKKHESDKEFKKPQMKKLSLIGLIDNLHSTIKKLSWKPKDTEWANYYSDTNYSDAAFIQKKEILSSFIDKYKPHEVWDLGSNDGTFSRIASDKKIPTISFDIDPAAIEQNYLKLKEMKETLILPLVLDLTNPSHGIGWENKERKSFISRGPTDAVFALALIHHLAISNNLPFNKIGSFFSKLCNTLVIEFVPKSDSQIQRLLTTRIDVYDNYSQVNFENDFSKYFELIDIFSIVDSERIIYIMKNKTQIYSK
jgi:hypothetical protein